MKEPLVEIIVLNTNGKAHIFDCLDSLEKTNYKNLKVSVVDQKSTDGSPEKIETEYKWVNLIRNKENNGFVGGNNQILKKSKAKYCIMLNDDTTQDPNWISELVKIAEKDEKIAALQPKVRSLRDKKMFEYAGAGGGHIDRYGYSLCRGRVYFDVEKDNGQYDDLAKIFWCCGVAMMLRMSVLNKIGYLDEDYFIYFEEVDLAWRMNLSGYKQVYVPSSVIYHLGSATMGDLKSGFKFKKIFLLHRNGWITVLKNYSFSSWWKVIPMKIFLELAAFFRFLLIQPMRSLAILKANLWVVFNLSKILEKHKEIEKLKVVSDKLIMARMINRSIIIGYFIRGMKKFEDYIKHIKNFDYYIYE